jgi:aspartyl-tRNA(Asn)/glutamyl-tRNA(Gln) amidotransferase subunit C
MTKIPHRPPSIEQHTTNFYPFSMQIDTTLISRLEKLARLQLSEPEREKLTGDLQRILDMVDTLQALDTQGIEPLVYLNGDTHLLREDEVGHQLDRADALANAPKHDDQFFRVPKVIE